LFSCRDKRHCTYAQASVTPPELSADIIDHGIMLTGGGALMRRPDCLLAAEISIRISVAENPLLAVAYGTGKVLGDEQLLSRRT
jgi:rod shape-determining protein MreB